MSRKQKYVIDFVCHYVRKFTDTSSVVLDVGCGRGQYFACTKGQYIGLDITTEQYSDGAPRKVEVVASAESLPFADGSVDFIMTVGSFYQVLQPQKALAEFYRVLKPKGRILIVDYNRRTQERLRVIEAQQRPCWTHSQLLRMVESAGFDHCMRLLPFSAKLPRLLQNLAFIILERIGIWAIVTGIKRDNYGQ